MGTWTLLGIFIIILLVVVSILAIWLVGQLLCESEQIKEASETVQNTFECISVEIDKKLLLHKAIHFADLVKVVKLAGDRNPKADINLLRDFKNGRVHITVESFGIKAKYTMLATIVEYGIPRLNESA